MKVEYWFWHSCMEYFFAFVLICFVLGVFFNERGLLGHVIWSFFKHQIRFKVCIFYHYFICSNYTSLLNLKYMKSVDYFRLIQSIICIFSLWFMNIIVVVYIWLWKKIFTSCSIKIILDLQYFFIYIIEFKIIQLKWFNKI